MFGKLKKRRWTALLAHPNRQSATPARAIPLVAKSVLAGAALLVWCAACSKDDSASDDGSTRPSGDVSPTSPGPPHDDTTSDESSGSDGTSSGNAGGQEGDVGTAEAAFEPPDLPNVPLDSVAGTLTLFASTLKPGASGLELYAGVRNEGAFPLCGAALQLEIFGQEDQQLGTVSAAVQSGRVYRLPDSETTISCVAPGQTAMAAATSLPEGLLLEDIKSLGHRFPAFQINDAVPLPGPSVTQLEAFSAGGDTAYRGTVTNTSDKAMTEVSVSVFALNSAGRPLAVATSAATTTIAPGGTWDFETSAVAERGADQLAFAFGSFAASP